MKSIIVKNLQIQFDSFDEGADKHTAINMLEEINTVLQERFPDASPQMFVSAVDDDDDIEISDSEGLTKEMINDLMVAALEGGINYWCGRVTVSKFPECVPIDGSIPMDEVIGEGGILKLHDAESSDTWELTKEKFLKGVEKTLEWGDFDDVEDMMDNHDAEIADVLIQYALFNEIVFG